MKKVDNFIKRHPIRSAVIVAFVILFAVFFHYESEANGVQQVVQYVPATLSGRVLHEKKMYAMQVRHGKVLLCVEVFPSPDAKPLTYYDEGLWKNQVDFSTFIKKKNLSVVSAKQTYLIAFQACTGIKFDKNDQSGKNTPTNRKWRIPFATTLEGELTVVPVGGNKHGYVTFYPGPDMNKEKSIPAKKEKMKKRVQKQEQGHLWMQDVKILCITNECADK